MPSLAQLAFSTNAFKATTYDDAAATIAEIGYAGVEVMADQPHFTPVDLTGSDRRRLAKVLRDHGLRCSNVNAFTGFFAGDTYQPTWLDEGEARRLRVRHTLASIELAAELGAPTVSLQPGGPTIGRGLERDEALGRYADGLHEVLPAAQRLGVTLAVEPEPGLLIESAAEYDAFKRRHFLGEKLVRMNCDLGHLFCVGEDPAAVIRREPNEIAHVHLEDIAASRVHQHLVPGDGAIDFPAVFTALDEVGYEGWVTTELYPFEQDAAGVAGRAFEHLKPMLGNQEATS